jgi:dolichyl-phosphate beta-glucosyltransferase
MSGECRFSVVIPFKDEEDRLPNTVKQVLEYFFLKGVTFEIILVDDGSVDQTVARVSEFLKDTRVRLLRHEVNKGKGAAIRTGVLDSRGEMVLFMDADMATPIEEFGKLLVAIRGGADIAIGSRAHKQSQVTKRQPAHRVVIGKIGNALIRLVLGLPFSDTQCGFKMFMRATAVDLFSDLKFLRWSFDYEVLYLARRHGYKIVEVPIVWHNMPGSKFHPVKDAVRCFCDLLSIKWRYIFKK